jgi:hypothetical protein
VRITDRIGGRKFHSLLLRALSLFGPGELRAVRVISPECFDVIVSELDRTDSLGAVRLAQALGTLRAVAWSGSEKSLECAFEFVERYGAALTELDCSSGAHHDAADRALACCTRLETLTNAEHYSTNVWLGLSHLHTLRGVDLEVVSAAAIAAALPRLHTLEAFISNHPNLIHTAAVAGFFEDLVPRLRVLRYHGPWPKEDNHAPAVIVPRPLPLLQELNFCCFSDSPVARGFVGAQPAILHMHHADVTDMLLTAAQMVGEATYRPLARVRDLSVALRGGGPDSPAVAQLLRAAPQLRTFNTGWLEGGLEWHHDPAFTGLVHPLLRSIHASVARNAAPPPADCGVQLQRLHFPRLQQLTANSVEFLMSE